IGSAPGNFMVKLADKFSVVPFGVEYTAAGTAANRLTFSEHGYNPEGVIEADVFSSDFQAAYRGKFDVVISRGFIEHFSDPKNVLDAHLSLLKQGGLLIVLIPNLRGIYWAWTWLFNRKELPLHNLDIMRINHFRTLFDPSSVDTLRCNYLGTFTFWLFTAESSALFMNKVLRGMHLVQRGINIGFRLLFGRRGCETAWFSPNLLFVGKKCKE
ncbi:class I SAM-dependent methyltransferase, partial [Sulfurirhabdus autotrophica]